MEYSEYEESVVSEEFKEEFSSGEEIEDYLMSYPYPIIRIQSDDKNNRKWKGENYRRLSIA